MSDGFRKQLTTPVDIPKVQPIQPTPTATGDVLQLASFGLDLYQRDQAQKKESNRQLKLEELTGKSQQIASKLLEDLQQQDLSPIQQAIRVDKAINSSSQSPTERDFMMGKVGEILKTDVFSAAIEAEKSSSELMTEEILKYPPSIQGLVLGGKNLDQMTDDQKRDALDAGRQISLQMERARLASEKLSTTPSVTAFSEAVDSVFSLEMAANEQVLGSLIQQVSGAGGDPESVELLSQARLGLSRQLGQQETIVRDMYSQVLKDPKVTKEQLTKATAIRDNSLKQLTDMKGRLDSMDDEQFENAAKMANLLKSQMELELRETAPEIFKLKDIAGSGYNALMGVLLNRLPNFKDVAVNALEKGAIAGFLSSPEGQATVAQTFDLKEMNLMLEGKTLSSYDADAADAAAGMRWNMIAPLVENPEMLDSQPQVMVDNLTTAMIQVLDRADEVGDQQSLVNANKLLSSKATEALIAKVSNPESQRVLANYVASSTAALFEDKLQGAKGLTYDTTAQRFMADTTDEPELAISTLADPRARASGQAARAANQQRKRDVEEMNNKLNQAASLLVKYNPAISDVNKAKDYLLIGAPGANIQGELTPFRPIEKQAIKQAVELQKLEEDLELKNRVKEFAEGIRRGGVAATAALGGQLEQQAPEEDPDKVRKLRVQALRAKHPELEELSDEEILAGL